MAKTEQILRKLEMYRKDPDIVQPLSNTDLAELVIVVLSQVRLIEDAIKQGRLDGKTPEPDKDYLSKQSAVKMLANEIKSALAQYDKEVMNKTSQYDKTVRDAVDRLTKRIESIRDGKDGVITEVEITRAAQLAAQLAQEKITIPDVQSIVNEQLADLGYALDEIEVIKKNIEVLATRPVGGGVRGNPKLSQIQNLYIQDTDPGNVEEGSIWIRTA